MPEFELESGLAVYATGSYARHEASVHSDLDLFFVDTEFHERGKVSRISKTLIDAKLIMLCRDMGFPEFSGDAKYLAIHSLQKMKEVLGTPADDYSNLFTARILLLLESTPLINDELYKMIIKDIVGTYYRDFSDHEEDFRPLFLLNDIIRFWRTVCLNYESGRNVELDEAKKRKIRVKNLKLKFSRPFTCFSAVAVMLKNGGIVSQDEVVSLVHLTPAERLLTLIEDGGSSQTAASGVLEEYSWFLEATGRSNEELETWLDDPSNHSEAMIHAHTFSAKMYDLLVSVAADEESLRYLVI